MIEVGPDLKRREPGQIEPSTWGEVGIGNIVRDKRGRLHTIVNDAAGWVQLKSVRVGEVVAVRRPAPETPVDIYVPSEEECLVLLREDLGARMLFDIEERERSIAKALTWRVEPVANRAQALRDHLDMLHGINVDDVLRKNKGTEANPAPKGQRAAALKELRDLHDEAHSDHDLWPMAFPHVHTLDKKEN